MVSEGVDYELSPSTETGVEQAWDVRLLHGDFTESVIRLGNIAFDGENDCLTFNFMLISTPVEGLSEDDVGLQDRAADSTKHSRRCSRITIPSNGQSRGKP